MTETNQAELVRCACRIATAGAVGASVAHELRNALAVAESALFLALRNLDDRERLTRHLDQVGAEIRKAHGVIGSILGLARGEPVHREPTAIAQVVEAAGQSIVVPPNVTFEVAIDPPDLTVLCDPLLLERVIANLYLNAIEAFDGRARGLITTRARRDGARTLIEVEDDGPGLDPAICERVFEPMVTAKPKGTGLGLTLCRTIIDAHGGKIACASGRGGGAVFRIWLPSD